MISQQMRVAYTPRYYADIGKAHIFPIRKFELVRDRLSDFLRMTHLAPVVANVE